MNPEILNKIMEFQKRFLDEDEHGLWSVKQDKHVEFHTIEELIDYLYDLQSNQE